MIPLIFHSYLPAALLDIFIFVAHHTGLLALLRRASLVKNDTVSQTVRLEYPECFIDTTTIQLVSPPQGHANPSYAILSHRWGQEEIDGCEDFASEETKKKIGYQKILKACDQARIDGYKYLWADTCCISKDPAKRSRDIQSMFAFYKNAAVCYVHLFDVGDEEYCCGGKADSSQDLSRSKDCTLYNIQYFHHSCNLDPYHICLSDWFRRGWTLQELIAPKDVRFYGKTWNFIGTKSNMQKVLSDRTSIPCDILTGNKALSGTSRLDRITWSMGRMTTKPADQAYCLMGILDIFIEPKNGESVERASKRLSNSFYYTTVETGVEGVYEVFQISAKHTALRRAILGRLASGHGE
ncbi:hypothetical protein VKT23_006082 [Stygiomarasmius scandens]|uniref:Heterokaryon incompatibility domain-containing protein n=1 Tax=Marasmiellus scandens TaxID=2682957 RepID=A0ABR1JQK7_9AGAR